MNRFATSMSTPKTNQVYFTLLFALIFMLTFSACENEQTNLARHKGVKIAIKSDINLDEVSSLLRQKFDSSITVNNEVIANDTLFSFKEYQSVYMENNYKPVWITNQGVPQYAIDMLEALKENKYDGINVNAYKIDVLENESKTLSSKSTAEVMDFDVRMTNAFFKGMHDLVIGKHFESKTNKEWKSKNDSLFHVSSALTQAFESKNFKVAFENMKPTHPWYQKFRNEFIRIDTTKFGKVPFDLNELKDSLSLGYNSPSIKGFRQKLFSEVNLPVDTMSNIWSEDAKEALLKYQHANQLKSTGILDSNTRKILLANSDDNLKKLALNMERMRWLSRDFKQPYIFVNIPKMELEYVEHNSTQFKMRVVVGRTSRPTPTIDAKLENVVFSPPWNVPPTIMKEEVVPGIARKGGSYLARRGLKAYDRRGRVVNASAINASNYKHYSIAQAPGYRSSLGEVKFNMPNPWAIYLHDTPHREDFVKSYRALSSGCIRVHHPKEFAEFLLRDSSKYSMSKIDSICKRRVTIFVPMNREVNVHLVYLTNAVDSVGNVIFLKDIYNWDKADLALFDQN